MTISYALVSDVWNDPGPSQMTQGQKKASSKLRKMDPACTLLSQPRKHLRVPTGYDNIVDAYLEDPESSAYSYSRDESEREKERIRSAKGYDRAKAFRQEVRDTGDSFEVYDKPYKIPIRSVQTKPDPYGNVQGYDNYTQENLEYGRIYQDDSLFHAAPPMFKDVSNVKKHKQSNSSCGKRPSKQYIQQEDDASSVSSDSNDVENEYWVNEEQYISSESYPVHQEDDTNLRFAGQQTSTSSQSPNASAPPTARMYLDLTAYVVSGILLIFMMEQILQLGMYLGSA